MKVIELVPTTNKQPAVKSSKEKYEAVKYNAMKHGVLSTLTVLPHENSADFEALREALVDEHQPSGPTEAHLVEDLAATMWRKRRVLLAEGAIINSDLRTVVTSPLSTPAKSAVPFGYGMPDKPSDLLDLIKATPQKITQSQREAKQYREQVEGALRILLKGNVKAYEKALKAMSAEDRESWEELIEEETYQPTADGLRQYINDFLWPFYVQLEKEAIHHDAIKSQTLGEGLQPVKFLNLNRYETHLDRKLERTLAMLIKLKELRSKK